jgi:hypothetical protein
MRYGAKVELRKDDLILPEFLAEYYPRGRNLATERFGVVIQGRDPNESLMVREIKGRKGKAGGRQKYEVLTGLEIFLADPSRETFPATIIIDCDDREARILLLTDDLIQPLSRTIKTPTLTIILGKELQRLGCELEEEDLRRLTGLGKESFNFAKTNLIYSLAELREICAEQRSIGKLPAAVFGLKGPIENPPATMKNVSDTKLIEVAIKEDIWSPFTLLYDGETEIREFRDIYLTSNIAKERSRKMRVGKGLTGKKKTKSRKEHASKESVKKCPPAAEKNQMVSNEIAEREPEPRVQIVIGCPEGEKQQTSEPDESDTQQRPFPKAA